MTANLAALLYLVSGVLFILALRGLSSPETSRQGNIYGMFGMAIAIGVTLWLVTPDALTWQIIGGAILIGATLDFLGLGPAESISLGLMMNNAFTASALLLGSWWWFVPPGVGIIAVVGGLYIMNVGLDEVFNPKLRST